MMGHDFWDKDLYITIEKKRGYSTVSGEDNRRGGCLAVKEETEHMTGDLWAA